MFYIGIQDKSWLSHIPSTTRENPSIEWIETDAKTAFAKYDACVVPLQTWQEDYPNWIAAAIVGRAEAAWLLDVAAEKPTPTAPWLLADGSNVKTPLLAVATLLKSIRPHLNYEIEIDKPDGVLRNNLEAPILRGGKTITLQKRECVPMAGQGALVLLVPAHHMALRKAAIAWHQVIIGNCTNVERQLEKNLSTSSNRQVFAHCEIHAAGQYMLSLVITENEQVIHRNHLSSVVFTNLVEEAMEQAKKEGLELV